jgi:hypothetical protein
MVIYRNPRQGMIGIKGDRVFLNPNNFGLKFLAIRCFNIR